MHFLQQGFNLPEQAMQEAPYDTLKSARATAGAAQGPYPRLDRTPVSAYLSGRPGTSRSSTRDGPGTTARRVTLFALPNLWMVRKRMLNMDAQT